MPRPLPANPAVVRIPIDWESYLRLLALAGLDSSRSRYGIPALQHLKQSHPIGVSCSLLAALLDVSTPAVTRLADRLEGLSLLYRSSAKDRRKVNLHIKAKGLQLLDELYTQTA